MQTWMKIWEEQYRLDVIANPSEHMRTDEDSQALCIQRMRVAFERGSYNKDSGSIRKTCKILGIKHTYAAINNFITNHV